MNELRSAGLLHEQVHGRAQSERLQEKQSVYAGAWLVAQACSFILCGGLARFFLLSACLSRRCRRMIFKAAALILSKATTKCPKPCLPEQFCHH